MKNRTHADWIDLAITFNAAGSTLKQRASMLDEIECKLVRQSYPMPSQIEDMLLAALSDTDSEIRRKALEVLLGITWRADSPVGPINVNFYPRIVEAVAAVARIILPNDSELRLHAIIVGKFATQQTYSLYPETLRGKAAFQSILFDELAGREIDEPGVRELIDSLHNDSDPVVSKTGADLLDLG